MKKRLGLLLAVSAMALGLGGAFAMSTVNGGMNKVEKTEAATDYSDTIRVYVDLSWGGIDYVRVGGKEPVNNAILTSDNPKYKQNYKYVKDIVDDHDYERMGFFFSQTQWWQYKDWDGYVPIDGGYKLGHQYRLYNVNHSYGDNPKYFTCSVEDLGEIEDLPVNPTVYFVDGHSWHAQEGKSVHAYFYGGSASCTWAGELMTDSGLRLKAYVGSTEYSGLHIYQYTISGSATKVVFNNGYSGTGNQTGDEDVVDGGIYFFGVNANDYSGITQLLVSLKSNLGSYTYKGRNFTSSICHLSQSQASTFVSTYDTLVASGGAMVTSVPGSGLVTYDQQESNNTHTGEVSLEEIRTALVNKYSLLSSASRIMVMELTGLSSTSSMIAVIASLLVATVAIGGYFLLRKKRI